MRYFKVQRSYDVNDFIPIDETELEKALHAFITGAPVVFLNGATQRIDGILPDYHRAMGWNYGYKLQGEDWAEVKKEGVNTDHLNLIGETKNKVQYLLKSGRQDLIGQNVPLPELGSGN